MEQNQEPEEKHYTPEEREKYIAELQKDIDSKKPVGKHTSLSKIILYSALAIVCLVIVGMFIDSMFSEDEVADIPSSTVTSPVDTQPATMPLEVQKLQEKRYAFIQEMIANGIFLKVEQPADYPHAWVTPLLYSLNFEDKEGFVSVIYAYYITQNPETQTW